MATTQLTIVLELDVEKDEDGIDYTRVGVMTTLLLELRGQRGIRCRAIRGIDDYVRRELQAVEERDAWRKAFYLAVEQGARLADELARVQPAPPTPSTHVGTNWPADQAKLKAAIEALPDVTS